MVDILKIMTENKIRIQYAIQGPGDLIINHSLIAHQGTAIGIQPQISISINYRKWNEKCVQLLQETIKQTKFFSGVKLSKQKTHANLCESCVAQIISDQNTIAQSYRAIPYLQQKLESLSNAKRKGRTTHNAKRKYERLTFSEVKQDDRLLELVPADDNLPHITNLNASQDSLNSLPELPDNLKLPNNIINSNNNNNNKVCNCM